MQKEYILSYLSEIKNDLVQNGIEKIGLFGSFARDKADAFSDVDIVIKIKNSYLEEHDVWEYFNLLESIKKMLLKKFSRKVDVYDLDSSGDIRESISKDVIYV
jgi:predicted nucleotidyltransferase